MIHPWQDPALPAGVRAADLLARMTPREKTAQLYSVWPGSNETPGGDMAPLQHALSEDIDLAGLLPDGLGQLTRPFGTAPVEPAEGAARLASLQERIRSANRFRLPALAHEECLTGFTAWRATVFPTPLAWGATFDPALVKEMASAIGASMRSVGIHQGLAPVLDVVRDPRWGRTEESIGEDPHLVATVGTAYVQGLQSAGVVATLKHFAGYSASRGARNHAPASIGPRELADVILPPFEMAVREGGARSVMAAYNDLDGLPAHAHHQLLTQLLREEWGFAGTVVADYFGVSFLESAHGLTDSPAGAAALALAAGVDVELPAVRCYGAGPLDEESVDRAALRVLTQKCELGLLDPDWTSPSADGPVDLDPPHMRALARRLAEESVVLLANGGGLPFGPEARRIAVLGPLADDPAGLLGCYTFPRHVLLDHPDVPMGVAVPTLLEALRAELLGVEFTDDAVGADVCVIAVGDRSGLFGRGTSGEGCDAADLELPEGQSELVDKALASGTPVVLVLLSGRPYALGRWADRCAAVVQTFFAGQEGAPAIAGVLSGRVNPSGRLPVSVPRDPAGQPWTYLAPPLGRLGEASTLDPTPLYAFGHGLSYTSYAWLPPTADDRVVATDGETTVRLTVRNTGERAGTEVVQLYLHDPVGKVARPVARLVGYARVPLEAGASAEVHFTVPAELAAYTGPDGRRIVEPGELELRLGVSSADGDLRHAVPLTLTGPERVVGPGRRMRCEVRVK
ncbi:MULTISPECIES: glycoside hydrolase family 3 N-terminal domain-containing protein [unclassified Streptomyces]|uniref:beta-xylosidase/alpha-l-arabinosidase n=1 Tax=unclassified Streptomyces TaxID=2593676 RepID=UPI00224EE626|nr:MULTISPECIES: glycoside hydrolase family 3 N-terminal domain-containing protein [unclassified Streptomyces]MCX4989032.1 glycoside hydrolase family 3 C-terminal domain-containing protein [Streptomyces sp. NBC_00568]MCX5005747.1 glycoside hydrolase family 3 C-terminal domain-containing protein [Streptomyces sp. NBC_00638]